MKKKKQQKKDLKKQNHRQKINTRLKIFKTFGNKQKKIKYNKKKTGNTSNSEGTIMNVGSGLQRRYRCDSILNPKQILSDLLLIQADRNLVVGIR